MKISDFLSPTDVLVDVRASNKEQLLKELARRAGSSLNIAEQEVLGDLLKREAIGSTGMGNGIAIPHARFEALKKPFGILARLKQPIGFDAIDEQPVDIVFVLLLPTTAESAQLGALACAARKLRAPADLAGLRSAKNPAELYAALTG